MTDVSDDKRFAEDACSRLQLIVANCFAREGVVPLFVVASLTVIAILPSLMVDIPAMTDYPNHLARMHLLVSSAAGEGHPFYEVQWALYPNLAIDLLVPQIARLMGVEPAAKAFLILSQLLVVSGAIAIEFVVKRRHEIAGFAALIVLYNVAFAMGLLNFEFGLGVALWAIACWLALQNQEWYIRLASHALFVFALFAAHFFALGVYGATIGLYELRRVLSREFEVRHLAGILALLVTPAVIALSLVFLTGGAIGGGATEWRWITKLITPLFFINPYDYALSSAMAALLATLLYFAFREGHLSFTPPGKWVACGILLLFIVLPFRLFGTSYVDVRLITVPMLILPAFVVFSPPMPWMRYLAGSIAGALILINICHVAAVWWSHREAYADIKASFRLIERGSFVLVGSTYDGDGDFAFYHAPTLAAHYAKALVSTLYTVPGMQPIRVRPELAHLQVSDSSLYRPVALSTLLAAAREQGSAQVAQFVRHWQKDFDYLYLVGPPVSNPMPDMLQEVTTGHQFALYRITR